RGGRPAGLLTRGSPTRRLPGPRPSGTSARGVSPHSGGTVPDSHRVPSPLARFLTEAIVSKLPWRGARGGHGPPAGGAARASRPPGRGARASEPARGAPGGADGDRARAAQPERVAAGDHVRRPRRAGPPGPPPPQRLTR